MELKHELKGRTDLLTDEQIEWLNACWVPESHQRYYIDLDGDLGCENSAGNYKFDIFNSSLDRIPIRVANYSNEVCINGSCKISDQEGFKKSNLKTLGGFVNVTEKFVLIDCENLRSLEGSPTRVELYNIIYCLGLKNLEGITPDIERLVLQECTELVSLKGMKKLEDFCFSKTSLKKLSNPFEMQCLSNSVSFDKWQRSGLEFSEYVEKYSASIQGDEYGI